MNDSEKIQKKLDALVVERNELVKKIKRIPQGYYAKKLVGYRIPYNGGSLFDAIRNVDYNSDNAKFVNVLTFNGKEITKEKLNGLRSSIIETNEPIKKRIGEIDELAIILHKKLIEAKANELLKMSGVKPKKKKAEVAKENLSGHGDLRKFTEDFIASDEFKQLNIPKHETLKANHKLKIESILHEKFPKYKINLSSFFTILRELDYSKPRKK
jgi:hypothetical protein